MDNWFGFGFTTQLKNALSGILFYSLAQHKQLRLPTSRPPSQVLF